MTVFSVIAKDKNNKRNKNKTKGTDRVPTMRIYFDCKRRSHNPRQSYPSLLFDKETVSEEMNYDTGRRKDLVDLYNGLCRTDNTVMYERPL